jgi:hypothetical protein
VSGHKILTTSYLVVALKGLAERLALFFEVCFLYGGKYRYESEDDGRFVLRARGYLLGCRQIFSIIVSKVSISPSAISLAAIALIDASSKAFLQLSLPSRSVINSTKSPETRFSAAFIFHSIDFSRCAASKIKLLLSFQQDELLYNRLDVF